MKYDPNVYGYVNGKPAYSADEYVYMRRGFGAITSDRVLMEFAEKVTGHWQDAGWKRSFADFYLSDYALSEPYASLTNSEFSRLKQLQKEAREKHEKAEAERRWKKIDTFCYADNSIEEVWEDKDGKRKTITVVGAHGDAC